MDNNSAYNEMTVIGSMLIEPSCVDAVSEIITADDFVFEINKAAFTAILSLAQEKETVDPVLVIERIKNMGADADGSAQNYILESVEITPTAVNAELYAQLVADSSKRRKILELASDIQLRCMQFEPVNALLSDVSNTVDKLSQSKTRGVLTSTEGLEAWLNYRDSVDGNSSRVRTCTGYKSVDNILGGGLIDGGLYIIAARPGMGKTTVAVNFAEQISKQGMPVLFASLEMSEIELTAKRIALESGISYTTLLLGKMGKQDYERSLSACAGLNDNPLYILERPNLTVQQITMAARRIKGLRAVFVDYIQLVRPERKSKRYEDMTDISNDMKRMAKNLMVPVFCLAQLNRENESRSSKLPRLSDLRDTGAIEQDADVVMFPHRDAYYDEDREQKDSFAPEYMDLIIAKNRHSRTGKVGMTWYGSSGRILENSYG